MSKESHSFSVAVATEVGVPCAIVLQHILFLQKSNVKDGEEWRTVWVRRSVKSLTETYPYFTMKEIRGAIDRLEGYGRIVSKVENDNVFDRKKSFQVTKYGLELLGELPSDERANADIQKGKTDLYKRANDNVTKGQMLDYNIIIHPIVEGGASFENTPAPSQNFTPFKEEEKEKNKVPAAAAISAADAIEADGIISAWSAENLETVKFWHERSKRIFSLQEYDKLLLKFCGYYANHKDDGTQKRFLSNPLLFFRNQFSGWLVDQPKFDRAQPNSAPSAPINKFQLRPNPSKS